MPVSDAGGPFALIVEGKNTIRLGDVLVGDVWVASGQSNMEFPMKQTAPWSNSIKNMQQELAAANHPQIRVLRVEKTVSDYPKTDAHVVGWSVCTPDSVSDFSAVAYFFARELEQKEHVPIGVVEASWGGTPAEAWTSLDSLSADASLMPVFRYRSHMMDDEPTTLLNLQKMQADMDRKIAQGQAATMPLASGPGFVGACSSLQWDDRSASSHADPRRHLVSGRKQHGPGTGACLWASLSNAHSRLADEMGDG